MVNLPGNPFNIPVLAAQIIGHFYKNPVEAELISFRTTNFEQILYLRKLYDNGKITPLPKDADKDDLSFLLVLLLKEMQESLLTYGLYEEIIEGKKFFFFYFYLFFFLFNFFYFENFLILLFFFIYWNIFF